MKSAPAAAVIGATLIVAALSAQTPATPPPNPSFEVASVKANKSGTSMVSIRTPPNGTFTVTNLPLFALIGMAYQLQNFRILDAPEWTKSERFDIVAKAEAGSGALQAPPPLTVGAPSPVYLMLRSLLAERFKLGVHTETRNLPIYALNVGSRRQAARAPAERLTT